MRLDAASVRAGFAAAMKRMSLELEMFKQQAALDFFELRRELDAALQQVHETRLEYLNFKASVTHDREQLARIERTRMLTVAQTAQRDPTMPLQ
jgi:hypothetical protein